MAELAPHPYQEPFVPCYIYPERGDPRVHVLELRNPSHGVSFVLPRINVQDTLYVDTHVVASLKDCRVLNPKELYATYYAALVRDGVGKIVTAVMVVGSDCILQPSAFSDYDVGRLVSIMDLPFREQPTSAEARSQYLTKRPTETIRTTML